MRRAANADGNQPEVIEALRRAGVTVQPLHTVGSGCPDLLCGFRGINVLLEVKRGDKSPSRKALNGMQERWHGEWAGQCAVAETAEDAIRIVIEEAMRRGKL